MSVEINPTSGKPLQGKPSQGKIAQLIASPRQEQWLALMLLSLHGALLLGLKDPLARALLMTHFGLFLLWQPLWSGEQELATKQVALVLIGGTVLVVAGNWWLMALWISLLFSLIGGDMPGIKNVGQRAASLLGAVYLLSILLMWVVPHLFTDQAIPDLVRALASYGLLIPVIIILFIRARIVEGQPGHSLDSFYSMLLFALVVVLVLGSFVIKEVSHGNYVLALTQTLFAIALFLVTISWLWDPRAGFAGIGQIVSRYFLSVGVPFERWMHSLAGIAEQESDPDKFAILAAHDMANLPWVSGVGWRTVETSGNVGEQTNYTTEFESGGLALTLYTRFSPGPSLVLHIRLLTRLLGDYYENKVREAEQRRNAYLQAIYETGSRLTHDVKNLLQSLRSLCSAAESSEKDDAEAVRVLMQRQLPQIAQRLQITLDKLGSGVRDFVEPADALVWWQALKQRFAHEHVEFSESELPAGQKLPAEVFESVGENLLQNALHKRRLKSDLPITVSLAWQRSGYVLTVCDDGEAVADSVARQLFNAPVSSSVVGLGVGLYQASRFAQEHSHVLRLLSNESGKVCFELAPAEGAP
ncbi:MAG: sensor histidine kinase [Verrucomicrobia bacterium]|nr:sensor histidine kinase [Verrucomicrobiota bacterium]